MNRIAIIAAMPGELLHLARGWKHEKRDGSIHLWRTMQGDVEWVAACAGAGQAAATRAFAEVEKDGPVTAVISTGWVGALTEEFVPGYVYAVGGVIDAQTGERFEAAEAVLADGGLPKKPVSWRSPAGERGKRGAGLLGLKPGDSPHAASGTAEAVPFQNAPFAAQSGVRTEGKQLRPWLVTSNRVANAEEKARLAGAYSAGLVDMEAAAVARLAAMRRIPFCCIKAVSDGHAARLPDFNRFLTPNGHFQLARFIFFAILRPWYWPGLMRMSENSSKASQALRDSLLENLRRPGAH
jgi:adenosylhomocysteine nucleosidase